MNDAAQKRNLILSKELFWNDLKTKYPNAMKEYCDWVDEYKKSVDWDYIFKNGLIKGLADTKNHDLPIAFQFGVFMQFLTETAEGSIEVTIYFHGQFDWISFIREWFEWLEKKINGEKSVDKM